jgi:hypothetical protein
LGKGWVGDLCHHVFEKMNGQSLRSKALVLALIFLTIPHTDHHQFAYKEANGIVPWGP